VSVSPGVNSLNVEAGQKIAVRQVLAVERQLGGVDGVAIGIGSGLALGGFRHEAFGSGWPGEPPRLRLLFTSPQWLFRMSVIKDEYSLSL
jgi:hypothetical protein